MKRTYWLIIGIIFVFYVSLRLIYAHYGYIQSEEGFLLYGQRLAFSGLLPFTDYNAWNSLLNNYFIGWYQWFIKPTIMTQRFFGIGMGILVFALVMYICHRVGNFKSVIWATLFLTFGSYAYLYWSTIPFSEQTMTMLLLSSWAVLVATYPKKPSTLKSIIAFILAVIAIPVRPQAVLAVSFIWLYIGFLVYPRLKQLGVVTFFGVVILSMIYLPFAISSWDNFLYSIFWPFKAHQILVYQYGVKALHMTSLIVFIINVFREYGPLIAIVGSAFLTMSIRQYKNHKQFWSNSRTLFIWSAFLSAMGLSITALLHRPPYSTYVYPAVPLFAFTGALALEDFFESLKGNQRIIRSLIGFFTGFIFLNHLITFSHADYMKTSLSTIKHTPYSLLQEISYYIEGVTAPGDEVLSFYIPAAVELNRIIPKDMNEGEGSISILSRQDSHKYHLTNVDMLSEYIASEKAKAIVMSNITPRFFGITEQEKERVLTTLATHYELIKTFDNFSQIGNPRVKYLYVYVPKSRLQLRQ